jgi:Domain of unknown function (DUF4387)
VTTLGELASVVRSKNAGPFWITVDIFLADESEYERAARSGLTDPAVIADRYGIHVEHILIFRLPELLAVKISFPRPTTQGSVHDRDMHAGQQYVALLDLDV